MNDESTETSSHQSSLHERLAELCINFHQLQDELLNEADAEKGSRLQQIAGTLIGLGREQNDQLLGAFYRSIQTTTLPNRFILACRWLN